MPTEGLRPEPPEGRQTQQPGEAPGCWRSQLQQLLATSLPLGQTVTPSTDPREAPPRTSSSPTLTPELAGALEPSWTEPNPSTPPLLELAAPTPTPPRHRAPRGPRPSHPPRLNDQAQAPRATTRALAPASSRGRRRRVRVRGRRPRGLEALVGQKRGQARWISPASRGGAGAQTPVRWADWPPSTNPQAPTPSRGQAATVTCPPGGNATVARPSTTVKV